MAADDISLRPYFIRAVYQWCVDRGHTPHLAANWGEGSSPGVPARLVQEGKIVFNISPEAVRHLTVDADGVYFTARFFGKTVEVQVPMADVTAIYAREQMNGIAFPKRPAQEGEGAAPRAGRRGRKAAADIKVI